MIKNINDIIGADKYHIFKIKDQEQFTWFYKKMIRENIAPDNMERHELPLVYNNVLEKYGGVDISIINSVYQTRLMGIPEQKTIHVMDEYGNFVENVIEVHNHVPSFKYVTDCTSIPVWSKSTTTNEYNVYNTDAVFSRGILNVFYD